ncbi:unnamed protein product [Prorocentrum cordatum]|uniref:AdoMet activation domain-containing protein n=1 Tax=Prorocentrum cordatum TaxID=2364126 RepID=A0ABN9QWI0_9DINO|nr:unnamed protein product [Polarella glacialis]
MEASQAHQLWGQRWNHVLLATFKDGHMGAEALKLLSEATERLDRTVHETSLHVAVLHGPRHQADKGELTYRCRGDLITPKGVRRDHLAALANTVGFGRREQRNIFEAKDGIEWAFLPEALADRPADASAELTHREITSAPRGYAPEDKTPQPSGRWLP